MIEIRVPRMGMDQGGATVLQVYVAVGDHVSAGEPLAAIEGDKTTFDVEADEPGVIAEILAVVDETANVGDVLFRLEPDIEGQAR